MKTRFRKVLVKGGVLLCIVCAGCGTEEPAGTPTATVVPSATPIPSPTPLPTLTPVPTPVPGGLYVDAGMQLGAISPYVYGTNYGPWVVVPYELTEEAEVAGIRFLRYPGGEWGDQNDLQGYQIDQFIDLARRMGAEPNICVRLRNGTPEKAAELVRYTNVERGYGVRYWSIGNEPNLFPEEDFDTVKHNADWRAIAEAMLAVDPDILLIGPNVTGYVGNPAQDPKDDAGRDWMREFLLANGDLVDVVAIHRYPFPLGRVAAPATVDDLRTNPQEWDTIIPNLRALIRETTGRDLPVAIGEMNSHWSHAIRGEATPDSFYNAIWLADVLGHMIKQRVDIVAHFILQSGSHSGGWGLLADRDLRPSYYVYQIYQRFGSELVYTSTDDADVSIYGALREDGALTLVVINLGPDEQTKTLMMDNVAAGEAEVWLFDAEHQAERVAAQPLADGEPITVPGQSITLYILGGQ